MFNSTQTNYFKKKKEKWHLLPRLERHDISTVSSGVVGMFRFLALLDYVSRAHEIEIRPSVRPSVRGIDYL